MSTIPDLNFHGTEGQLGPARSSEPVSIPDFLRSDQPSTLLRIAALEALLATALLCATVKAKGIKSDNAYGSSSTCPELERVEKSLESLREALA